MDHFLSFFDSGPFKSILNKPTLQEKVKITSVGSRIPSPGKSVRGPKLEISRVNSVGDWFGLQSALIFLKIFNNSTKQ